MIIDRGDTVSSTTWRDTSTRTQTVVQHVAKPLGRARENGPHLGDLRAFVETSEGLPDDLKVFVTTGYASESGRYDVTFKVTYQHPADDTDAAESTP